MLKRYIALTICIIMVFSLVGCGRVEKEEDKAKYTIGEDSKLIEDDMGILQKSYKELTDDEQKRLKEMMLHDMSEEELLKFKDDLERLYIEKWQTEGIESDEFLSEEFEKEFHDRLWQVRNPDKPLMYKGLSEEEIAEKERTTKERKIDPKTIRKSEIEAAIRSRINEGDYTGVKLDKITINEDMGKDEEGYYIALVRLNFQVKNRRKTANEMMRMYSDDLVATLAKKGVDDVTQAIVFWRDEYNDRDLKYAYEYKNGGFYITDIMGE